MPTRSVVAGTLMLVLPVLSQGPSPKQHACADLPKGHPALSRPRKEIVPLSGKVLQDHGQRRIYLYLPAEKRGQKIWVAIPRAKVAVGKKIDLVPGSEFKNFKSKTLNRTFDKIIFSLGPVSPRRGLKKER